MTKRIKFMPASLETATNLDAPKAAKASVPDWYRKASQFIGGKMIARETGGINKDLKLCVPFLDALTAGYCIELPCDVLVEQDPRGVGFFWHELPEPIEMRSKDIASTMPRPLGCDEDMYAWMMDWAIQTPPGYSLLVTHPFNRFDLPFVTTSGIMDSDMYASAGQIPFFLKAGFSGVIPAGTPIAQLIPIKRDDWVSEELEYDEKLLKKTKYKVQRFLYGGYKKLFWQKKNYS